MESSEIGRIKLLIYLSILGSFVAGIFLLFVNFEEGIEVETLPWIEDKNN